MKNKINIMDPLDTFVGFKYNVKNCPFCRRKMILKVRRKLHFWKCKNCGQICYPSGVNSRY